MVLVVYVATQLEVSGATVNQALCRGDLFVVRQ